jgi:2-polyprenyl-6-hydroxyphenyl methylase/3-demethylubiquinone-9 3-methyltransferase
LTTPNGGYFRNRLPRFSECPDPSVYEAEQFKPDADGHIFLIHVDELAGRAQPASLEIVDIDSFTNPLTVGQVKLSLLHHVLLRGLVGQIDAWSQARLPPPLA